MTDLSTGSETVAKSSGLDYSSSFMLLQVDRRIRSVTLACLSAVCVGLAIAPSALADPAAPSITSAPSTFTNSSTWSVEFSGDTGNTFECRIDTPSGNGTWDACESPIAETTGSADGTYTVRVRQVDGDSVTGPAASATFTIDTVAPDAPGLTGAPEGETPVTSLSIALSGESGATFSCSLDSASYAACTSPFVATSLADGSHSFSVKQIDAAGNESLATEVTWTVDTIPPSAATFTDAQGSLFNTTSRTIEFSVPGDAATVDCSEGTSPAIEDWSACGSPYSPATAWSEGSNTVNVRVTDTAGNSAASSLAFTVDSIAPDATVFDDTPDFITNNPARTIAFTAAADAATVECAEGASPASGDWAACTSPYAPASDWADGTHTVTVRATDAAGNSTTDSISFSVDATAPAKPMISGTPSSPTELTAAEFTITGEEGATLTCTVDGGTPETCTSPFNLTDLAEGAHQLEVTQTDAAGNTSEAETASWTILIVPPDTTPPDAPELSGTPTSPTNSSSAEISFSGEPGGTYSCSIDSGSYEACTSPLSLSDLGEGPHSVSVTQTDAAGNTGLAGSASWEVDLTAPPVPSLSGLPTAVTLASGATATFSTTEPSATFQCRLNMFGTINACSSPWIITGLNAGVKTVYVRAKDAAGNVSAWATATWPVRNPCGTPFLKNPIYKDLGKGNVQIRPFASPADVRAACQLLTVQVWNGPTMPLNSDHLTNTPSFSMKIVRYSTLIKLSAGRTFVPKWIRVENKVGTWSNWYQLGKTR